MNITIPSIAGVIEQLEQNALVKSVEYNNEYIQCAIYPVDYLVNQLDTIKQLCGILPVVSATTPDIQDDCEDDLK